MFQNVLFAWKLSVLHVYAVDCGEFPVSPVDQAIKWLYIQQVTVLYCKDELRYMITVECKCLYTLRKK